MSVRSYFEIYVIEEIGLSVSRAAYFLSDYLEKFDPVESEGAKNSDLVHIVELLSYIERSVASLTQKIDSQNTQLSPLVSIHLVSDRSVLSSGVCSFEGACPYRFQVEHSC